MPDLETVDGIQLHYRIDEFTDPWRQPESILLINGFCETTEAWRAWVPHLSRLYRVIRFDQFGFGQSSRVAETSEFTTQRFVDHAVQMASTVADGPVHVIGAKSGGLVAIELARLQPRWVKSLTLASTPLAPPEPDQWLAHMEQFGMPSWARLTMPPRMGSAMPEQSIQWWIDLMGSTPLETARAYMRWVSSIDVRITLEQVHCPSLVLSTTAPRRAYSRSDLEVYREKLPQARIELLPGDGYHVAASYPDACAERTLRFLEDVASG